MNVVREPMTGMRFFRIRLSRPRSRLFQSGASTRDVRNRNRHAQASASRNGPVRAESKRVLANGANIASSVFALRARSFVGQCDRFGGTRNIRIQDLRARPASGCQDGPRVQAHDEKRRFHICAREIDAFGQRSGRAVVEGQAILGPSTCTIEGDLRLSWRGRGDRRGRGLFFSRLGGEALAGKTLRKEVAEKGEQFVGPNLGCTTRERKTFRCSERRHERKPLGCALFFGRNLFRTGSCSISFPRKSKLCSYPLQKKRNLHIRSGGVARMWVDSAPAVIGFSF